MSGHSKWSSIKHKKANTDAKRGQLFTKICKEITIAARGGGDPAINSSLRLVIQRARDANVPNKNIDRAIERATGGGDADQLEEMSYEGYGPGGTAVLIDVVTDNKNRTVADLRLAFSRGGGSLAENGTVAWQFELRGVANVAANGRDIDEIQLTAIEAGAIDVDVSEDGTAVEIYSEPSELESVRAALTASGVEVEKAEVAKVPKNTVELDEKAALATLKLLERLDDLDDVSRVYSNAEFPEAVLEAAAEGA